MMQVKQPTSVAKSELIETLDGADVVPLASAYHAGELIGDRYRLLRRLGEGGMGVVWVARNVALDSDVAIKMLRAGRKSEELERRMLKEARAAARLGHPAILRVFDFGATRLGDPYMVMELLEGEDLGGMLDRCGRLSPTQAVRTLLPILHALGTAHQKGIIHRDLKPDNIFLANTDSGHVQPKLVDFGIVKTEVPDAERLTHVGTVLGTPLYFSPEQACGENVDARSDIWSAAVVLYEMVTCEMPFDGSSYNALMRAIIERAPVSTTRLGVDDSELWAIIERGLTKRASDRWPSMAVFGGALADWLLARGETIDISGASLSAAWHRSFGAAQPPESDTGGGPSTVGTLDDKRGAALGVGRGKRLWGSLMVALIGLAGGLMLSSVHEPSRSGRAEEVRAEEPLEPLEPSEPNAAPTNDGVEIRISEDDSAQPKPAESKPAESKPAESKPTQPKPTQPKPTQPKPAQPAEAKRRRDVSTVLRRRPRRAVPPRKPTPARTPDRIVDDLKTTL